MGQFFRLYGVLYSNDALESLAFSARKAASQSCAYILSPGSTIFGIVGVKEAGMDHLWPQFIDNAVDGSIFPKALVPTFFGGVDKQMIDKALPDIVRFPMSSVNDDDD